MQIRLPFAATLVIQSDRHPDLIVILSAAKDLASPAGPDSSLRSEMTTQLGRRGERRWESTAREELRREKLGNVADCYQGLLKPPALSVDDVRMMPASNSSTGKAGGFY